MNALSCGASAIRGNIATRKTMTRFLLTLATAFGLIALGGSIVGNARLAAQEDDDLGTGRIASGQQMKRIMLAMYGHLDQNKKLPAAVIAQDGKPLLSWRVGVLPYLEDPQAKELYAQFHLDEPWDSEHNKTLIDKMPEVYRSPASKLKNGRTVYLTPRGDGTAFPGKRGVGLRDIRDGTSKTIALVEVEDAQAVPWTKPDDWKFDPAKPKATFKGQYGNGMNTAFVDGSVHFVSHDVDEKLLGALLTIDGREVIKLPD
jgi:prepilin-type processing-associated H-X9-DG protein